MLHILDLGFLGHDQTIAAFLVPTDAGLVLVETGPYSTYPALTQALAAHGYQPADVTHVLLSHIHFDHAGAAWALAQAGATVYVHPFGAKHLAAPAKLYESARRIYQDQMDVLWGEMRDIAPDRLRTVAHGEAIAVGSHTFTAWHTPGHAVHHVAWQWGDAVFAGDVAGVCIEGGRVVPPCPPPDIHVEDWQASIQLLRDLHPATLYLTHFGTVTAINTHLDQLEAELLAWANWMKPHYHAHTPPEVITPQFQSFVAARLRNAGLTDDNLQRYEAANPSWMSVAGLLRYWHKR